MKVIDEVTATYLTDLTSVVKWGTGSVDILVKTWPFVSIKNIRIEFVKSGDRPKCASCINTNAKQTAIFYGQPYQRETLQGCKANSCIPNDMDKVSYRCLRRLVIRFFFFFILPLIKKLVTNFYFDCIRQLIYADRAYERSSYLIRFGIRNIMCS